MRDCSATNPENGTVTYTYNGTTNTLASKTDAKNQKLLYAYDGYNRLTTVTLSPSTVLHTYMYDTNTLDGTFSGSYTQGRLVAVQNAQFTPGNGALLNWTQLVEMYGYTQAGSLSAQRLQVNEHVPGGSGPMTLDLDAAYTYDSEGKMTSVNYPTTWGYNGSGGLQSTPGPTYTYSFDSMSRLSGMTDQNNNTDVSGVSYDAGNRLLSIDYFGTNESRQYNTLGQLTQIYLNSTTYRNYNYPSGGTNNGKVSSIATSGETVTYQYDSLNRMLSAAGSGWAETYSYDSFGNLSSKTPTLGTPPSLSQASNPANNQIVGQSYDANGNQLTASGFSGYATYDPENRMVAAPGIQYGYDSRNRRGWAGTVDSSNNLTGQTVYFYGAGGTRLGTYTLNVNYTTGQLTNPPANVAVYFGGKRLDISEDRLGSNIAIPLYPWGEDRGSSGNDQVKFATYTRDSATLLDYANNRYYSNAGGRFMTPDPSASSQNPRSPQSWNRYPYVLGDPVNNNDPTGLDIFYQCVDDGCGDGGGGGGGGGGYCDASQGPGYCGDPCVGADGFAPNPSPNCQVGGPPPVSVQQPAAPTQPLPTCTLEVESRTLDYFGLRHIHISLHGYLVFTSSAGTDIIEGLHTGKLLTANANSPGLGDSPSSDTDDGSISGPAVCAALSILQLDASKINGADITYKGLLGPNSSSALSYFLESVSYLLIDGPWYTIPTLMQIFGYNTPLPGLN